MNVLALSDNEELISRLMGILTKKNINFFDFAFSSINQSFSKKYKDSHIFKAINLKDKNTVAMIIKNYDLILSFHCKQIFPKHLVESVRCINIHPGLNPYNRGWYPQVFSIINKLPLGATIHEMDYELDHGPIIFQKEVKINSYETSLDCYQKVLDAEIELLDMYLEDIISGNYKTQLPSIEGNINYKNDFTNLCHLDLDHVGSLREHIDLLRALTHGNFTNAYFVDENGNKVNVKILLNAMENE